MRKKFHKLYYISGRVFLFEIVLILFCFVLILSTLSTRNHYENLVCLILCAGMAGLFYRFVWLPYKRCENMIEHMASGYAYPSELEEDVLILSPSLEHILKMSKKILTSPQSQTLNRRQAQYIALQNQINPHFLYNTLDSIRSEILIAGRKDVADMTEALASFFRYTISKVENLVTIEEELDNCMTYFKIQHYRFGERLKLNVECDPDDFEIIKKYMIPKLTLQPLLENSIIHGTELKVGQGIMTIRLEVTATRIIIDVRDNGVGMNENTLRELNERLNVNRESEEDSDEGKSGGGIALVNVNKRIRLLFGEEYGITVFSTVDVGTNVCLTIPICTTDNANY